MDFTSISETVKKYSPLLANMLSLSHPMLGATLSLLYKVFDSSTVDQLNDKILNSPDAAVRIKEIEFKIQQLHSDSEYNVASMNDVEKARERDEAIIKLSSEPNAKWHVVFISLMPHFLTILVGFSIFSLVYIRVTFLDDSSDTFLTMVLLPLIMIFREQCRMYYGEIKDNK